MGSMKATRESNPNKSLMTWDILNFHLFASITQKVLKTTLKNLQASNFFPSPSTSTKIAIMLNKQTKREHLWLFLRAFLPSFLNCEQIVAVCRRLLDSSIINDDKCQLSRHNQKLIECKYCKRVRWTLKRPRKSMLTLFTRRYCWRPFFTTNFPQWLAYIMKWYRPQNRYIKLAHISKQCPRKANAT